MLYCWHYEEAGHQTAAQIEERNAANPFWLVQNYVGHLSERCYQHYQPYQFIDVDEQCIPFMGRHYAVQFNPNKPNKWHFKVFALNCSETGYMYNFFLFPGKDREVRENKTFLQQATHAIS